ncbi:hypothetical protein GGTG_04614 [Gaeumannomyces tritici R3-111a-1]|uniref:Uncharacterized protein n=1 Tax=Gaeumannomyces tritici (strain R3-111a-1) TaxID=644352 RepID=J3NTL4_GAET3|nr:hypothetical protein GGTG_04614 [Gaeumannomyces tritici R3-111a-1]EJT79529.1 hypothetical protein GGTG_04614 [Gaeumannomyces tritici R3-111a-1]
MVAWLAELTVSRRVCLFHFPSPQITLPSKSPRLFTDLVPQSTRALATMKVLAILTLAGAAAAAAITAPNTDRRDAEVEAREPTISFLDSVHYKREAKAEPEAEPAILFNESVHYKRDDQCADLDVAAAPATKREADPVLGLLDRLNIKHSKREAEAEPAIRFPDSTHYRKY